MSAATSAPPAIWRRTLSVLGAVVLGGVLLVGAWGKGLDPGAFAEQIRSEGLDLLLPAEVVVYVALLLEIGLGTALLLGVRRLFVLVPSAALVAFFLFLTGRAYWRSAHGLLEETAGCGCFGNLLERTPAEAFWQDLALLLPALLLTFLATGPRRLPTARLALTLVVTAAGLLFAWRAPELPLDDLATRLEPGRIVAEICSGRDAERICLATLVPELEAGEHLVVIADLADDRFGEAVDRLNATVWEGTSLFVLGANTPEQRTAFFWRWGPSFEIREAPASLLRPLYRTLPRSFRVRDGEVVETWSGLPPLAAPPPAAETTDATGAA
jgi:uncharacterized membrane protein YphA (DoxX/SURF4 family)